MVDEVGLKEFLLAQIHALETRVTDFEARNRERLDEQANAVRTAMEASEKAVLKAENAASLRAAQQNEWRGAYDDIARRLPTRAEFEAEIKTLGAKYDDIKGRVDRSEGAATGQRALLAIVASVVGILVGAMAVNTFFQPDPVTVAPQASSVQIKP